ncbi:MAG: hypothetical protein HKO93_04060, partial [Flavobacteriales bacterium]|nr:hypothetical protein [Flavobacteriales bacterium]
MRVILLIIILSCVFTSGRGQFTYFNQTAGGVSDSLIDSYTNVEVLGDTLYIYGGIDDDAGDMRLLLRKYNVQGQQVGESEIEMPFGTVFMETTASFVKSQDDLGFHITISVLDSVVSGWVCSLTTQFDTLWTNRYDQWSPFTSFRRNIDVGDGIVMAGENQPPGTQRGTILTKIDNEGELVWSTELQHTPGVNIR